MEIAPIAGVRAVSLQRQPKAANTPQAPFKIDASERAEDDTWSPDRGHSDDTLEEESSMAVQEEDTGPAESAPAAPEGSTINVIV
jgi:hypothetical protein